MLCMALMPMIYLRCGLVYISYHTRGSESEGTHSTGPRASNFALVSGLNGVDATTQTPPPANFTAVERPPMWIHPKSANGL
jgi:hypothetical protein